MCATFCLYWRLAAVPYWPAGVITPTSKWRWPGRATCPLHLSTIGQRLRSRSLMRQQGKTGQMTFGKYQSDGAYHWDAVSRSLARHVAFTAGRYQALLDQPVTWRDSLVLDVACGDA